MSYIIRTIIQRKASELRRKLAENLAHPKSYSSIATALQDRALLEAIADWEEYETELAEQEEK